MHKAMDRDERRRSARVNTRLLTQVRGVDTAWVLRRCNLSVSGILIELDAPIGEPASVQHLRLLSPDKHHAVDVLARVVRTLTSSDLWRGQGISGVAFDFLVQNVENRNAIEELVRQVMQATGEARPQVQLVVPTQLEPSAAPAQLFALGLEGMLLRASRPMDLGSEIRCQIQVPGRDGFYSLQGQVVRCDPARAGNTVLFEAEVRFAPEPNVGHAASPTGLNIGDAIDALLDEAVFQAIDTGYASPRQQLKGVPSRIRLPSLLTFLEMERMSGVLSVSFRKATGTIFVRNGQVVDCQATGHPAPMDALQHIMQWSDGDFEFRMGEVERPDVLQMSTTHLLLKLTHEAEEHQHVGH